VVVVPVGARIATGVVPHRSAASISGATSAPASTNTAGPPSAATRKALLSQSGCMLFSTSMAVT
jgi:hypothetical protein